MRLETILNKCCKFKSFVFTKVKFSDSDKRIIIKDGGIVKILNTSLKEKGIAHYLNWVGNYGLDIRKKIRKGEEIKNIEIYCEPVKSKNNF